MQTATFDADSTLDASQYDESSFDEIQCMDSESADGFGKVIERRELKKSLRTRRQKSIALMTISTKSDMTATQ